MDIHSSCSQSYVTLTCGRIIPASHQSEISTESHVVFEGRRPDCSMHLCCGWVINHLQFITQLMFGGMCSIKWVDKQQLCYNTTMYVPFAFA